MPGIAAGIVTEAQVNSQPAAPTKFTAALSDPATWAIIWTAAAFAYLAAIYLGMIVVKRRGE
jgi:hypothetical protein